MVDVKPFSLFIRDAVADWTLEQHFGVPGSPPPPPPAPELFHDTILKTSTEGKFYAAFSGQLSVFPATAQSIDLREPFEIYEPAATDATVVRLYLHMVPTTAALVLPKWNQDPLLGICYGNVEISSLAAILAENLDKAFLPRQGLDSGQVLEYLLSGEAPLHVTSGQQLGVAALVNGSRELHLSMISDGGVTDPGSWYELVKDAVVEGSAAVDELLTVMPVQSPVFGLEPLGPFPGTEHILYPYTELRKFREANSLGDADWRIIRNNQKALYLERLGVRFGTVTGSQAPPFEFVGADRRDDEFNLIQLEAIVEFFANHPDPWAGFPPQTKFLDTGSNNLISSIEGDNAVITGTEVALTIPTADPDLSDVLVDINPSGQPKYYTNHYFIHLNNATSRKNRTYRILDLDVPNNTVTVDEDPGFTGQTDWRLFFYKEIDLLDLRGDQGTVSGMELTLEGKPDLTRLSLFETSTSADPPPIHDTVEIEGTRYRILDFEMSNVAGASKLILDVAPGVTGPVSWRIHQRPVVIVVDPLGARTGIKVPVAGGKSRVQRILKGSQAVVDSVSGMETTLILGGPTPDLGRINREFDTIYLAADTSTAAKPVKTYRIKDVPSADKVVVTGLPDIAGDPSPWHIQSGIGGDLPAGSVAYCLAYEGIMKYDHYDGISFIVHGDKVRGKNVRWSSFTSAKQSKAQLLSSIRGNREYDVESFRSPELEKGAKGIRLYCFKVVDRFAAYDGVRENRFYFNTPATPDTAAPGSEPSAGDGKTRIRLHRGTHNSSKSFGTDDVGSGSGGCLVSPTFERGFRDELIRIYEEEHIAVFGTETKVFANSIKGKDLFPSKAAWKAKTPTESQWNGKMIARLWLIRPDEKPL